MKSIQKLSSIVGLTSSLFITGVSAENSYNGDIYPAIVVQGEQVKPVSIQEKMQTLSIPGISIAVVSEGEIVWTKNYGIANVKDNPKLDDSTLFQAGSISKPIAALAALKLVDEGKIDLDTDVNSYLKDWQVTGEYDSKNHPVTLRHLLTHTGGLTVHGFPGYATGSNIPSTTDVLNGDGNTAKVEVDFEPGSEWRYSGGGYTVMQKVVEDITGLSFAEYTDENILKPMGMNSSTYEHKLPKTLSLKASAAFDRNGKAFDVTYNDYPEKAAAGLWTTPTDLAKYALHMQAIMQGNSEGILKKSTVEAMLTKHLNNWGLGPELYDVEGVLVFGHGGKNLGFSNEFRASVDSGNAVIIMSNGDSAVEINRDLMISVSEHFNLDVAKQRVLKVINKSEQQLKAFEGDYQMSVDKSFVAQLRLKDGNIRVKVPGDDVPSRIVPTAEMTFNSVFSGNDFVFQSDDSGEITGFIVAGRWEFEKIN